MSSRSPNDSFAVWDMCFSLSNTSSNDANYSEDGGRKRRLPSSREVHLHVGFVSDFGSLPSSLDARVAFEGFAIQECPQIYARIHRRETHSLSKVKRGGGAGDLEGDDDVIVIMSVPFCNLLDISN